ncbi:HDOD domain-containing protein [Pseudomonas fluorescens]|uniref:HDOD domain-containing protein n=1 Tax=Pseudomonas fluorescens TaxID=294 RepID=A0A944E2M7_PSEFL|nr:HDOD domain-containing protein [Pseudomonas fluorescens]MBT2296621.1 HDOD domain-containing protein [Pseudomonas fluorescens]MBT2307683.1 HDOD domain-containing protein [Pseudomonas fluorescens]MBT2313239.1 HDOD domain-containing protein [Pseudomonas fluorescens]MBT2317210.1 HDOD domain-containing protein [Pseudomonas fluorescens]MBT2331311.1 HDOD domain-containing protein [Pseudomonas fluorescens]
MANETKVPTPRPTTLEGWVKLLEGVHLPVPQASHDLVCKAIADSHRSLRDIAELIQDSPALALSVIREANHHTHGNFAEPAENLEVAINRLGLKRTEELLARLPSLPEQQIPIALRQLQLISQHATQQANGFFASRLARLWQDIHWGSLLFLSPLWPLALTHPGLLKEWELRVVHKGQSASKVERELFGVGLLNICLALVETWRLPVWVAQGYRLLLNERRELVKVLRIARDSEHPLRQQNRLDDDPTLRRWLNQPANTVLLANGLALSAQQAWDGPHSTRWQYLTSLYLQMSMDDVQQQLHQQAVNNARHNTMPDLWHPAVALIWPRGSRRVHPGLLPPAPPSAEDLTQWRKQCAELLMEPSPFSNAMHLTTSARDALVACGMQRVMILMADRSQTSLRVHQIAGLPKEAAAMSFSISQSKVLQRLQAQQAQVRLNPDNNAQFSALLPPGLRSLFRGEHLLLRSLTCNGRVIMLVAVDQGGGPFSDVTVQAFGKTVQCIERALHSFTNRGR